MQCTLCFPGGVMQVGDPLQGLSVTACEAGGGPGCKVCPSLPVRQVRDLVARFVRRCLGRGISGWAKGCCEKSAPRHLVHLWYGWCPSCHIHQFVYIFFSFSFLSCSSSFSVSSSSSSSSYAGTGLVGTRCSTTRPVAARRCAGV